MSNNLSQFQFDETSKKGRNQTIKPQIIENNQQKDDRLGSRTAPAEQDLNFGSDMEDPNEINSYNYYIYYESMKSKNPSLPKPTFNPIADLDFMKENKIKDEEESNFDQAHNALFLNDNINNINNQFNNYNKGNMDSLNQMMGNLNLQGGANQGPLNDPQNPNFYDQDGRDFNPLFENYLQNDNRNLGGNKMIGSKNQQSRKMGNMDYYNNPPPTNLMQIGTLSQQSQGNMMPSWDDDGMMNPNLPNVGGMAMKMNFNDNPGMNFYHQERKGKKQTRKNNNKNSNPNFNKPNNAFDPMSFQNSNLYNAYYNTNSNPNMGNFPGANPSPFMGGKQGNKNLMGSNFSYFNDNPSMPFNLMGMAGLGNLNMGMPGLNMGMGMGNMNMGMGNLNNMNMMQNFNQKPHRNRNENGNLYQKKEPNEPPSLEEIINKAVELSKDHSGSRLVQKKYEEGTQEDKDKIFEKLKPEILPLSKDVFGNYAIQKVLETKDPAKNKIILDALKTKIYDLSLHMYGCRVIQQLLNVIDEKYVPEITEELAPYFEKCIEDQNGNHVIQKIIERLHPGENNGIYDVVLNNIIDFSIHQYGCRVIQKLFNQCNEEQRDNLLEGIYKSIIDLCQDQYGNYVIQYVLEKQKGFNVQKIYDDLKGKIFDMSIHKFGSNVIEKALSYGSPAQRAEIINEIISKDDLVHDSLLSMVKDKFGNYVVQKMIEYSDQKTKDNIIKRIISSQSLKKRDGFCKLL